MHWMAAGGPAASRSLAAEASGARFRDVDGHEYVDLCLGDTGAMTGYSPPSVVRAVAEQAARGITLMLPSEEAIGSVEELTRRFGLARWQFALTATYANRFTLRIARHVTGRPKVLVFNWCYHGTVDETLVRPRRRAPSNGKVTWGLRSSAVDHDAVVEFNDVDALEREFGPVRSRGARRAGDDECRDRPPRAGLPRRAAPLTRERHAALIDETHTLCAGPGGYTAAHGLEPDVFTSARRSGAESLRPPTDFGRARGFSPLSPTTSATWAVSAARSPRTSSR